MLGFINKLRGISYTFGVRDASGRYLGKMEYSSKHAANKSARDMYYRRGCQVTKPKRVQA